MCGFNSVGHSHSRACDSAAEIDLIFFILLMGVNLVITYNATLSDIFVDFHCKN